MLARVIHKLILSCSVIAAVAVIVLAVRCRRDGDLLVCGARFGTYHELRADSGGVSWMQLAGWPILNDPLQSGRAKPKPSTISNWSEVIRGDRAVPLIDGVQLHLVEKRPAAKGASSW